MRLEKKVKKLSGPHSFAKAAIKRSIMQSIKKGKNPFSGRKFTKSQSKELRKLLKMVR